MIELAGPYVLANEAASADVRAIAQREVGQTLLLGLAPGAGAASPEWVAHSAMLKNLVERYEARPFSPYTPQKPLPVPPGDPIGQP